jgi:hypothetical protein
MLAKSVSGPPWAECEPAVVPTVARTLYIDVEWFGRVGSKPVRALRWTTVLFGVWQWTTVFRGREGPAASCSALHTAEHTAAHHSQARTRCINPSGVVVPVCCLVNYLCVPYPSLLSSAPYQPQIWAFPSAQQE